MQRLATQAAVPFDTPQMLPHEPQAVAEFVRLTSQPSAGLPLQSL